MWTFRKDNQTATVKRLTYSVDSGYKKSGYTATGKTYTGHLKAITIKDGVDISNFGKEFLFHTEYTADIKESDRLTIWGVEYDVKGVSKFVGVTFNRLQAVLQLW